MSAPGKKLSSDQKLLLGLAIAMLLVIVGVSILAPQPARNDPRPSTNNRGPQGTKAAFLTLTRLGVKTSRWTRPLVELTDLNAEHTTLVLAEPEFDPADRKEIANEIREFLERGGHVLATGADGAQLLPGGETKPHGLLQDGLCTTTPEGPGALAQAGNVELSEDVQWSAEGPKFRVEQRCDRDAVVVRYAMGQGEAIWWTSAAPMSNAELHEDADVRLLLASVGEGRAVVFDEASSAVARSLWDAAQGLPLRWLALQTALLLGLLVLSFSCRRGPVRMPVLLPRSSPVEFAESMGDLYAKGHATAAATDAAARRLRRFLAREAGLSVAVSQGSPEGVAEALGERLGGDWGLVAQHLNAVYEARQGIAPRSALALVRALDEDREAVAAKLNAGTFPSAGSRVKDDSEDRRPQQQIPTG